MSGEGDPHVAERKGPEGTSLQAMVEEPHLNLAEQGVQKKNIFSCT